MSRSPIADQVATWTGRGPAREQAICTAVLELLIESSYDDLTVDAVAAKAKSSKATIYRRWANKDELVVDVLHREFQSDGEPPPDTGSLRGDLLATLVRDICQPESAQLKAAAIRSLTGAMTSAPALVSRVLAELTHTQTLLWTLLLERAVARGEIAAGAPPELAVEVIRAHLSAQSLFDGGNMGPVYLQHLVDDIVMPVVFHAAERVAAKGRSG